MDIGSFRRVHFIGIGGIGMSALARYFHVLGKKVSGSDLIETDVTKELSREGINVFIGHDEKHVGKNVELLIYTHAIPKGNLEMRKGYALSIPLLSYAQAVGILTKEKFTIAVAGTHGKSTTTAMIALMMVRAELDPTVIIGTKVREFGNSNFRFGKSNFLLLEACEYKRSFLEYYPHILVITNVDLDHLDYFKNTSDYVAAFLALVKKVPHTGYVIANRDDEHFKELCKSSKSGVIAVRSNTKKFEVDGNIYRYPMMHLPGMHNKIDASLAFATGKVLNIPESKIKQSLSSFHGTWRRFEKKGVIHGALFFDDYGHHPTEVRATLQGMRELFPRKNIICVFQPHQYSRAKYFLHDFALSFHDADSVIIPNIYEARDRSKERKEITVVQFVMEIRKHHPSVLDGKGLQETAQYLLPRLSKNDVVITMGAGDVYQLYRYLSLLP